MVLYETAGWIAPIATTIAAMMTAANLGARVTGWGFVIFTFGSISWAVVGLASDQANLVATNMFLTVINLVGVWRWLGRQRAYENGARSATQASCGNSTPTLFAAAGLVGTSACDIRGEKLGTIVESMIECGTARVSYVVIASGGVAGIDEHLRTVPAEQVDFHASGLIILMTRDEFERRAPLDVGDWPGRARAEDAPGEKDYSVHMPIRESYYAIAPGK